MRSAAIALLPTTATAAWAKGRSIAPTTASTGRRSDRRPPPTSWMCGRSAWTTSTSWTSAARSGTAACHLRRRRRRVIRPPTHQPARPRRHTTPSTGSIAGLAFADQNSNDALDDGELPLAGAVISLKQGASEIYSATSQTDGVFRIDGIAPGAYTVAESVPPPGYERNTNRATFLVAANTVWNFLFGHQPLPTPTATYTPTATATPSATPTVTPTSTPTTQQHYLSLPMVLRSE